VKSFTDVSKVIPHDFGICENGGVVMVNGKPDELWMKELKEQIENIWRFEKTLQQAGYNTDSKGSQTKFHAYLGDDPEGMTEEQKVALEQLVVAGGGPLGLRSVRMLGYLTVIPQKSGKANAMKYLLDHFEVPLSRAVVMGDDYNDMDMMTAAVRAACPGNAVGDVQDAVRSKNRQGSELGYVSPFSGHCGTSDMIAQVALMCKAIEGESSGGNPNPNLLRLRRVLVQQVASLKEENVRLGAHIAA
jgi:3-deoxy-D-manno-octulosonate 8-phosphate phosphatase KdsC-like HAD superfamily phosphatase